MKTSNKILASLLALVFLAILVVMLLLKSELSDAMVLYEKHKLSKVDKEIPVKDFSIVKSSIAADIKIKKGTFSFRVKGDSLLVNALKVEVVDSVLQISMGKTLYSNYYENLELELSLPKLDQIISSGSGEVEVVDSFQNPIVLLELLGSGSINGKFSGQQLNCKLVGSGDILNIGTVGHIDSEIVGSGNIFLQNSPCKTANIDLRGSGEIKINVEEILTGELSGSGNIFYRGNPKLKLNSYGSGTIEAF
ncbi:MAG TPA: head GIN domain-containing protein [Saprospiraceae bacterium]|nr:head GIN domain-containing protein [Saprospiraceae bacterium]